MKTFFIELLQYTHHYNLALVRQVLDQSGRVPEKAVRLLNHLLNVQQIWNQRMLPESPLYGMWEMHPDDDLARIETENAAHSLRIIDRFDLEQPVAYTTFSGKPFEHSVRDILFHVINHANYHRAQVATEFRQNGLEPLASDYILYQMTRPS